MVGHELYIGWIENICGVEEFWGGGEGVRLIDKEDY